MVEIHEINNRYTWRFGTFNQTATLHKTKMVLQILHHVFYDLSQAVSYSLQGFLCSCKYHLHLRFALHCKRKMHINSKLRNQASVCMLNTQTCGDVLSMELEHSYNIMNNFD